MPQEQSRTDNKRAAQVTNLFITTQKPPSVPVYYNTVAQVFFLVADFYTFVLSISARQAAAGRLIRLPDQVIECFVELRIVVLNFDQVSFRIQKAVFRRCLAHKVAVLICHDIFQF